jgi:fumarate hydratase, class I
MADVPPFKYTELLPMGPDDTEYRLVTTEGVSTFETPEGTFLKVEPEAIRRLTAEAMHDIAHFLRSSHLQQLRNILDDPEASDNDRFVALDLLKNAAISAGGVLPMCQDTGTAIVKGKKGQFVFTGGGDEEAIAHGIYDTYQTSNLRYSQMAPIDMYTEKNTGTNLPAEIKISATDGDAYKFLFMAKGGGSANKSYLYQETKALLNEATLLPWIFDKMQSLGTSACPPYHLAVVIGGTSAEFAVETAKLASTRYLDSLPTSGSPDGHAFRDLELEQQVLKLSQTTGIGAQFGGKYFCHDVRVIRLPRHGASCPVGIAVSCSADRQALGKITKDGIFLEQLERDPARFLPEVGDEHLDETEPVRIDLNRPMTDILAELSQYPVTTRVMLTGPMVVARDIAHAKIKERLDAGEEMPQYLRDHAVYYAGPAKTPEGLCVGVVRADDGGTHGQLCRTVPIGRRIDDHAREGQPLEAGDRLVQCARRLLPRLDRRAGRPPGARQHPQGRGARVSRTGDGGGVEDRGRGLPGVHRRRRQGQRLLRRRARRRVDAGVGALSVTSGVRPRM